MTVYIIGGGTLARFIIDILESADMPVGGLYDDNYPRVKKVLTYPVLGKIADLPSAHENVAIAIGDPAQRKKWFEQLSASGHTLPVICHRSAFISRHAEVHQGAVIGPACNILAESAVGAAACLLAGVNINQNTRIGGFSLLGAGATIGNNAVLNTGCHVGMACVIAPNTEIEAWTYIHQ